MIKTKKLLSLALALMMAFSCMAMPAMAADGDEGIMPLLAQRPCTEAGCSGTVTMHTVTRYMQTSLTCEKCIYQHTHKIPYTVYVEDCDSCTYHYERNNGDYQFPGVCMHPLGCEHD